MAHPTEVELGFVVFLAAVRIMSMLAVAPMFGSRWVAIKYRLAIALVLTLTVLPSLPDVEQAVQDPFTATLGELFAGALLGLSVRILIFSFTFAGDLISQLTGWSLGQTPADETGSRSPIGRVFYWTMIGTFVACGGPNQLVKATLHSLRTSPPGSVSFNLADSATLTLLLHQSFELAIRLAAPALAALLIATLVLALIHRSSPTVNSFQVGFALKSVLAFGLAIFVVMRGPTFVSNYIEPTVEEVSRSIGTSRVADVGKGEADPR